VRRIDDEIVANECESIPPSGNSEEDLRNSIFERTITEAPDRSRNPLNSLGRRKILTIFGFLLVPAIAVTYFSYSTLKADYAIGARTGIPFGLPAPVKTANSAPVYYGLAAPNVIPVRFRLFDRVTDWRGDGNGIIMCISFDLI
jgi:hypothetical protein